MGEVDYNFFNQRSYKITLSASIAIFFLLFMLIFQPFGVNNYAQRRIFTLEFAIVLIGFTSLTFIVSMINEFLIRRIVFTKVTLIKIIGWTLWTFVLLGTCLFLLYNFLGNWHDFTLTSALEFILDISSVTIFPVIGTFFYFRYKNLSQAYQQILSNTQAQDSPDRLIHFEGTGNNESLILSLKDFLYAKAQDNYVEIVYRNQEAVQKRLIRVSLSDLYSKIESSFIVRCHRSYIVNLYNVRALSKGTEFVLYLNYIQTTIKVSKSYKEETYEAISTVKKFE